MTQIDEGDVSLRGAVELANLANLEAILELPPDLWAKSIADSKTNGVGFVERALKR